MSRALEKGNITRSEKAKNMLSKGNLDWTCGGGAAEVRQRGFVWEVLPIEVGCRGSVGGSVRVFFRRAGVSARTVRKAVHKFGEEAVKVSA